MTERARGTLSMLALLSSSLLVALLLIELILQLGAWALRASGRDFPASFLTSQQRILCLGDSNTYGLYLDPRESYPMQLEAHWNATIPGTPIEVVNLGYPGTNSSVLVREFPRLLRSFEPDGVLVMIGVNDFWTRTVEPGGPLGVLERIRSFVARHSRLARLIRLLASRGDVAQIQVPPFEEAATTERFVGTIRFGEDEFSLGYEGKKRGELSDRLRLGENLRALSTLASEAGTPLIVLSYPADEDLYALTNPLIRAAARSLGIPLIDLAASFRAHCRTRSCEDLFFPDHHPTAKGYQFAAKTIATALQPILAP